MIRNEDRDYGIITGEEYPEDLTGSDIVVCDLEDKVVRKVCVRGFENELQKRKNAIQKIWDNLELNLQNAQTTSNEAQDTIKDLQDKIQNIKADLSKYTDIFNTDEKNLNSAVAYHAAGAIKHITNECWMGDSPGLNDQCRRERKAEVTKKIILRDKSKSDKVKEEQNLNSHQATLAEMLAKHQDAQDVLNKLTAEKTDFENLVDGINNDISTVNGWSPSYDVGTSGDVEREGERYTEL